MKKFFTSFLLTFFFAALTLPVLAATTTPPTGGGNPPTGGGNPINIAIKLSNPFKVGDNLYDVAKALVDNIVMPIGGIVCVLMFIYAGFSYVTAAGNTTKIADANRMLLYAAIGSAVLLGAWVIANVVQQTVNNVLK